MPRSSFQPEQPDHPNPSPLVPGRSTRRSRAAYAGAFLLLLAVEVCIALFIRDRFVRPYVGDALVAPLVYCALQMVLRARPVPVVAAAFATCCLVEILQATGFAQAVGATRHAALSTLVGRTFDWSDIGAYGAGCLLVLLVERRRN